MTIDLLVASIATALLGGTAVLIAASGELLVEKLGIYNLGIEGVMLLSALGGFVVMTETDSAALGLLGGAAIGAAFVVPFAVAVVLFRADMLMAGLALVFIALGISGQLGQDYVGIEPAAGIGRWEIPLLSQIPYVGEALFRQLNVAYLAFLLPFAIWFLLNRTRHGLSMRAVGEDPVTADIAGVHVNRLRFAYVLVGGALAGVAGAFVTIGVNRGWVDLATGGQGWIALALVIFAGWRPLMLLVGAYLYGGLATLGNVAQALGWNVPSQVFSALPYLGTLVVLIVAAYLRSRRRSATLWPAALGLPFFRGG